MAQLQNFGPKLAALPEYSVIARRQGKNPLCLRDVRRIFNKHGNIYGEEENLVLAAHELLGIKVKEYWYPTEKDIDRVISLLGPRWPLEAPRPAGEERKKDTTEVAEQSADPSDGEMHGGDGNSGEVEAPAQTQALNPRQGPCHLQSFLSDIEETKEQQEQAKKLEELERTSGQNSGMDHESDGDHSHPKAGRGSVETSIAEVKKRYLRGVDPKDVKELIKALKRLFRGWEQIFGGREESPRWDAQRLAVEKLNCRFDLARCRRQEMEDHHVFLLMCDVSGSCSAASRDTLAACLSLVEEAPENFLLVVHSNGAPYELYGPLAKDLPEFDSHSWDKNLEWWSKVLALPLAGCVNWGDGDASDILEYISYCCPLLWLDSYCASWGPKPMNPKYKMNWPGLIAEWQGVNTARSSAYAVRNTMRKSNRRGRRQ